MTQPNNQAGAWIFISHSHRDLEKVRQIRNELEHRGHNPLLFFLKCLEDDDARLPELIRDEIKAREWFILCDSSNAKASDYVSKEIELVKALEGKVFETFHLDYDLRSQLHKLDRLSKRATVFLSYARQDLEIAERIRRALLKHDYRVWDESHDYSTDVGQNFEAAVESSINDAVKHGFVLVLLSPVSLTSQWCKVETQYALHIASQSRRSNVIPVIVAPSHVKWCLLHSKLFSGLISLLGRSMNEWKDLFEISKHATWNSIFFQPWVFSYRVLRHKVF